jgi:uncharacterized protein YprB with RNaseH-like and TPR domain/predicted nuclease with RNAse H fold
MRLRGGRAMLSITPRILQRTFIHIPGISPKLEKLLWENGISSWQKFLRSPDSSPSLLRSSNKVYDFIEQSYTALQNADSCFFAKHLPRQEWWRLYPHFEAKSVFLDIETTGLSRYYDEITLVGLYNGKEVKTLIAGHNLEILPELLKPYDVIVTFNGTLFDIPFLKTKFQTVRIPPIHLDLRYILKRLGYGGGLKQIEQRIGIKRSREIRAVDGLMATVLWARYQRGDLSALEQLIRYNVADLTSLQILMKYCYRQLVSRLLHNGSNGLPPRLQRPKNVSVQAKRVNGSGFSLVIDQDRTFLKVRPIERPLVTINNLLKKIHSQLKDPKVVGIDLRASEIRPTGWALLASDSVKTKLIKTDEEIIKETIRHKPNIISIDSPLTIPAGRCCTNDACKCRTEGILRECERTLWKRGVRVFPCLLPSMQKLTERGIHLAKAFRELGYNVIESYPGAAQDIMRIPRKKSSLEDLVHGLGDFGIKGTFLKEKTSHDELDAITSAVVGYFYLAGDYEPLGNEREGYLIIPKLHRVLSN